MCFGNKLTKSRSSQVPYIHIYISTHTHIHTYTYTQAHTYILHFDSNYNIQLTIFFHIHEGFLHKILQIHSKCIFIDTILFDLYLAFGKIL